MVPTGIANAKNAKLPGIGCMITLPCHVRSAKSSKCGSVCAKCVNSRIQWQCQWFSTCQNTVGESAFSLRHSNSGSALPQRLVETSRGGSQACATQVGGGRDNSVRTELFTYRRSECLKPTFDLLACPGSQRFGVPRIPRVFSFLLFLLVNLLKTDLCTLLTSVYGTSDDIPAKVSCAFRPWRKFMLL